MWEPPYEAQVALRRRADPSSFDERSDGLGANEKKGVQAELEAELVKYLSYAPES